jgi:transposase
VLRITDEQWELIRKHFPEERIPDDRPGRKQIPAHKVLEAVLWILNTGAPWHMLPQAFRNYKTVHRRFQQRCQNDVNRAALTELANVLRYEGVIYESECYIDAAFASARGCGDEIGPTRRGKGLKFMAIVDRHGLPIALTMHAANHHEVTLVQLTLDLHTIEAKPEGVIGDKAYDSDQLAEAMRAQGTEMISPHRSTRKRKTQDGRRLRRCERRWIVERVFAWLQWQRRLLARWEYYPTNFLGFVQLAGLCILLRQV